MRSSWVVQGKHTFLFTSISNSVEDLVKPPLPADAASLGVIVFDLVSPCEGRSCSLLEERKENRPKALLFRGEAEGEGWGVLEANGDGEETENSGRREARVSL